MLRRVVVLGSESEVATPDEQAAGQRAGRMLAEQGIVLVTSGFGYGPIGTVADAAVAAAGRVVGVVLAATPDDAVHPGLGECRRVPDRATQLRTFADLADAFLLLPGAATSLDEVLDLQETDGTRELPIGLLDDGGCYSALLRNASDAALDRFVLHSQRGALSVSRDLGDLLTRLGSYRPPDSRRLDPHR